MGNLSIRKVDDEPINRLREQAAMHGVSMEEARRILRQAVQIPERLGDLATQIFGVQHRTDSDLPQRDSHTPSDLNTHSSNSIA